MPLNTDEVVAFVRDIAANEQVRVTVTGAVKGGLGVGCAAAAGALLLGPIGFAVGGIVGGVGAAAAMRDRFLPLPQVVANLSHTERAVLAGRVEHIMEDLNATDIAALAALAAGSTAIRGRVIQEVLNYVTQEVQVAIA